MSDIVHIDRERFIPYLGAYRSTVISVKILRKLYCIAVLESDDMNTFEE